MMGILVSELPLGIWKTKGPACYKGFFFFFPRHNKHVITLNIAIFSKYIIIDCHFSNVTKLKKKTLSVLPFFSIS
jgi:hypothetical protein